MKNRRPFAASAKATGYPSRRNTTNAANMIGARFWATNSAIRRNSGTCQAASGPALFRDLDGAARGKLLGVRDREEARGLGLGGRLVSADVVGVLDLAADDGNALDHLAQPLQQQQCEAEKDQPLGGPDQEAAGIGRDLAGAVGAPEERPRQERHDEHEGQKEQKLAEHLDEVAQAPAVPRREDVDPDVLVVAQRPGGAEHEHRAEEVPLQLEPGV